VFGVAVVSNQFYPSVHWAYWVGPLIGAALAALVRLCLRCQRYRIKG